MGITFDGTGTKYIKWTAPAGVVGLTTKTILMWYYHVGNLNAGTFFTINDGVTSDADEYTLLVAGAGANTTMDFLANWSTAPGVWRPTTGFLTVDTLFHIGITYDGGNTANNAIFYINGVSVGITELSSPSGVYRTGVTTDFYIGSNGINSTTNPNGIVLSQCVYNRILSATEILEAYQSRKAIPTYNGLVFAPQLNGAAGLQTFGGATLAAGNTIVDSISGALGVPAGSPVGVGDTVLTY